MEEILLIARNVAECNKWFHYLDKHISPLSKSKSQSALYISTKEYYIIIRPEPENLYRGRRPDYHYAYGSKVNNYLLATGSKRLRSLDDVLDIEKGE